ncbi:MAG: hypothetical protein U1G07_19330 [Verrucomicrobiota bacterium]
MLARASLTADPVDTFALTPFLGRQAKTGPSRLKSLIAKDLEIILELTERFMELKDDKVALLLIEEFYSKRFGAAREPLVASLERLPA